MLKISLEPPKLQIAEEVKNLFKKDGRKKKKEEIIIWSFKERLLVATLLLITILSSLYFWYKGTGQLPQMNFSSFPNPLKSLDFSETIILEK